MIIRATELWSVALVRPRLENFFARTEWIGPISGHTWKHPRLAAIVCICPRLPTPFGSMADRPQTDDLDPAPELGADDLRKVLSLAAQTEPVSGLEGDVRLTKAVERQRRVALALRHGGPATPSTLRSTIDDMCQGRRQRRPTLRTSPVLAWRVGVAAALAAALAFVVVALTQTGGTTPLAASRVAAVWTLPATSTAIKASPGDPAALDVRFHGTGFPNYHDDEGWHPVGTRAGQIGGRAEFTVYYATGKRRSAYTVVAGTRVSIPSDARRFATDGLTLAEFRDGDHWVVVFQNGNNSCVLTAAAPREKQWLIKLAVWDSGQVASRA